LNKTRDESFSGDESNPANLSSGNENSISKERNMIFKRFFPTALMKTK
jgi:hypothetical protein